MDEDGRTAAVEYEIELVLRVKARLAGSRAEASNAIGDRANKLPKMIERAVAAQFGEQPELISADFRFRADAQRIVGASRNLEIPRPSKKAVILDLLNCEDGTTTKRLQQTTGWQPSTVSAQLDYLSKTGYSIDRFRKDGVLHYRLAR